MVQESLFSEDSYHRPGAAQRRKRELELEHPYYAAKPVSPDGPSVNIKKRARALLAALDDYSQASRLGGFSHAATYDAGIQHRYDPRTQAQIEAAEAPAVERGDAAFEVAYGKKEMIAAGVDEASVDRDLRLARQAFSSAYIGSDAKNDRAKVRRKLKKQI